MTAGILDYGIAAVVLVLAARAVFSRVPFAAIVYFVALGLVVALVWVRLEAPDIAIAEAAIGAGLTGALLFITWRRLGSPGPASPRPGGASRAAVTTLALSATLGALLLLAVGSLEPSPGLAGPVTEALPRSGVDNPVTAVLLNYRSFDTLLEIGVLLLAVLAVRALGLSIDPAEEKLTASAVLDGLVRVVVPAGVLVGAYLLWAGAWTPGGAFQAGAVWAGALVLMRLARPAAVVGLRLTEVAWIGLAVFAAAAVATYLARGLPLAYPAGQAGAWILVIEIAAAVSIAVVLYRLFALDHDGERLPEDRRE